MARIPKKTAVFMGTVLVAAMLAAYPCSAAFFGPDSFNSLKQRLVGDGFDQETIIAVYGRPDVVFEKENASLFLRHREARLNYDQFTTPSSISSAREYMKNYAVELSAAETAYGVDQRVVTAILLIETRLGKLLGRWSILNTLSTLASLENLQIRELFWQTLSAADRPTKSRFEQWAEKKSRWAYHELKSFLTYALREGFDPTELRGSYAGALGIAQFMPSSLLHYAKDGNRDGRIDLFDHADAIASVANYLKQNGWHSEIEEDSAHRVLYRYNRSDYYVKAILKIRSLLEG